MEFTCRVFYKGTSLTTLTGERLKVLSNQAFFISNPLFHSQFCHVHLARRNAVGDIHYWWSIWEIQCQVLGFHSFSYTQRTFVLYIRYRSSSKITAVLKIGAKNFGFALLSFVVFPSSITQKGVYKFSAFWTTSLLLDMFLFWFRAACEHQLVSYDSKLMSQSLSNTPFCACFN